MKIKIKLFQFLESVLTGAKNFIAHENGLSFRIPKAQHGINLVNIDLTSMDDYVVTFYRMRKHGIPQRTEISKHNGIYFDNLQELFTAETGLYTKLF